MAETRYTTASRLASVVEFQSLQAEAARGDTTAQYRLAARYEDAVGVDHQPSRALRLYRAAARADLREAQMALGTMLALGDGVERDYAEAWVWFSRAAGKGDSDAGELARLLGRELEASDRVAAQRRVDLAA